MCNPRRVVVTVTEDIAEAWTSEVVRVATATGVARGRARVERDLEASLARDVRGDVCDLLAAGIDGWEHYRDVHYGDGYRHNVPGGYVWIDAAAETLVLVAELEEAVSVEAEARQSLEGWVRETAQVQANAPYWHDGYGGRTREVAETEAREAARARFCEERRHRVEEARRAAEDRAEDAIRERAQQAAAEKRDRELQQREAELARAAAARLQVVGVLAQRRFYDVLGRAYVRAVTRLARARGATYVDVYEDACGTIVECELPESMFSL